MLRSSPGFPRDTECVDMPRGPQAFTYYSQDVPAYVASLFRVRPVGWGAMGDSTGGYCASKLAVTNSYVFPAAVALSGYAAPPQDLTTGDLFGGRRIAAGAEQARAPAQDGPQPGRVAAADHDPDRARTLRAGGGVDPPACRSATAAGVETRGRHSFSTWRPGLPTVLAWISSHLHPRAPRQAEVRRRTAGSVQLTPVASRTSLDPRS